MSKNKILVSGNDYDDFDVPIGQSKLVPKVIGVKPCHSQILVETLTKQELINSVIEVSNNTKITEPLQGYVRATGPNFKPADWGFDVGDRVIISGSGVIAPKYDDCHRDRFFLEPSAVKAVLNEEKY